MATLNSKSDEELQALIDEASTLLWRRRTTVQPVQPEGPIETPPLVSLAVARGIHSLDPSPEDLVYATECKRFIEEAVKVLTPYQEQIVRGLLADLSVPEIAARLKVSVSSCDGTRRRAFESIRTAHQRRLSDAWMNRYKATLPNATLFACKSVTSPSPTTASLTRSPSKRPVSLTPPSKQCSSGQNFGGGTMI